MEMVLEQFVGNENVSNYVDDAKTDIFLRSSSLVFEIFNFSYAQKITSFINWRLNYLSYWVREYNVKEIVCHFTLEYLFICGMLNAV